MTRTYRKFPDFTRKPMAFIETEDRPHPGCTLLKNGLWVTKNQCARRGEPAYEVVEAGAHPSRCAQRWSAHKTKREAILAALARKPFEHPADKAKRVEAAAQVGADPHILTMVEDLLSQHRNMFGDIDETIKCRLRSYLLLPTIEGWDDIHGIILNRFSTVWQLWIRTGEGPIPHFSPAINADLVFEEEWERIPTQMEIILILKLAATSVETATPRGLK